MSEKRDIFLCHAREDKMSVARPLIAALNSAGISYWYDEAEIKWGDSITQKVNEGLQISKYVVVIISEFSISKNWPQKELHSALNMEISSGEVRVLPLIVGKEEIKNRILVKYPLLNDKLYLYWNNNTEEIVAALKSRLSGEGTVAQENTKTVRMVASDIPMPKIKKQFTQRDRDLFIKKSFETIKSYFRVALEKLKARNNNVDTDFMEVHNYKIICTIYIDGMVKKKCKIWLGGMFSSDTISYKEGNDIQIDSDNSCNDWLSVKDEGTELGFEVSNMGFGTTQYNTDQVLSDEKAAEYLWRRFTDYLGN